MNAYSTNAAHHDNSFSTNSRLIVNLLNPAVSIFLIWGAMLIGLYWFKADFDPLSNQFYLYIIASISLFSLFSILGQKLSSIKVFKLEFLKLNRFKINNPELIIKIYLFCMALSLFFQIFSHYLLVGAGWWLPKGIQHYRYLIDYHEKDPFRFTSLLNYFFFSAIPICTLFWKRLNKYTVMLFLLFLCMFVYLSTARASIFTILILGLTFYMYFSKNSRIIFALPLFFISLFLIFYCISLLVGKGLENHNLSFTNYMFGPSHALDQIIHGTRVDLPGSFYTFRPIHSILASLKIIPLQTMGISTPYYNEPALINVYTMFGPFILDYGLVGSLFWIALFGSISGILYGLAKKQWSNSYILFLSALNLTVLILGIFYDFYTCAGFVWLSIIFSWFFFPKELNKLKM